MMQMPLSDIELAQLWERHQSGVLLSDFEITRLFDTLFEKQGRFEFVAKTARDYYNREQELKLIVESWAMDAENDLVLNNYLVIQLLDKIHPQWRQVFNKMEFPGLLEIDESNLIKIIKDIMKDDKNG